MPILDLASAAREVSRLAEGVTDAQLADLAFTRASARPEQAAGRAGLFGPVADAPEGGPVLDSALGSAGGDPAWTPTSVR